MQEAIKSIVDLLIHTLSSIHYIAFFISFLIWIFILIITFLLRNKKIVSTIFTFISILFFLIGPVLSYFFVELQVKERNIGEIEIKQLTFADKAIVKGTLTNSSGQTLKKCRVASFALAKKQSLFNKTKEMLNKKHYAVTSLEHDLKPSESGKFYITINKIKESDEFNFYYLSSCE